MLLFIKTGIGFLLMVTLLGGCSSSIPLSETYLFTKDEILTDNLYPKKDSLRWKSSSGGGLSLANNADAIKNHLRKNHEAETYHNLNKAGMAYNTSVNARYFSFGYNFGYPVLGVNATVELGWNNFVTLSGTLSGGEAILQRPVFRTISGNTNMGVAAGIFAKRNNYVYNKKADTILDILVDVHGLQDLTPIDVYGVRSMIHMRFFGDSMIHGFASYGHSPPTFRLPVERGDHIWS